MGKRVKNNHHQPSGTLTGAGWLDRVLEWLPVPGPEPVPVPVPVRERPRPVRRREGGAAARRSIRA